MEYTKNHHLPQWKLSDRILMEDFNQMCADIESGLTGNAAAAAAAKTQADKGVSDAAAAQGTANTAVSKADAAQATANQAVTNAAKAQTKADAAYSPSQKPYTVGSYTGTDTEHSISLGFRPSFLIVCNPATTSTSSFLMAGNNTALSGYLDLTSTGFKLYPSHTNQGVVVPPTINQLNTKYVYIAFR